MAYEQTFNKDLAKLLAKSDNVNEVLDKELVNIKERAIELNTAREKMADGYRQVLEGLSDAFDGVDLEDPNFTDSHNRMARALIELCSGLGVKDKDVFSTTFPAEEYDEVILLKDISFTSVCSHHFFPFSGKAHVGYLPDVSKGSESKVVGLSKLARIVDAHAQRPQLQERLSMDVLNALKEELQPSGAIVVMKAEHGCMNCRGAKKHGASMVTSALSGKFKEDDKLRKEFFSLIGM